jgi:uncharacterized membrane protein
MHSRNYYEVFLLLLTMAFAVQYGLTNAGVVTATFPLWGRLIWYVGLLFSAAVAVVGEIMFTNLSLIVERAALLFMTGLIMAYALAFIIAGIRTSTLGHVAYVALTLILFAIVNFDRTRQIRHYVQGLTRVYATLPTVGGTP